MFWPMRVDDDETVNVTPVAAPLVKKLLYKEPVETVVDETMKLDDSKFPPQ